MGKNPLKSIEDQFAKLEVKADQMREKALKWRDKYRDLKNDYDELEKENEKLKRKIPNQSELDSLRVQNSKLIIELNNFKRKDNRELKSANFKLKEIQRLLNLKD
jgi:chromosome segregation ATPase